jgi:curved DNA-binding protein CbpA
VRAKCRTMKSVEQCLEILGVTRNTTPEEIKLAYRDLVKVWHPDRFAHDQRLQQKAAEKLKEINEAYEQLQSAFTHRESAERKPASTGESKPNPRSAVAKNRRSTTPPRQSSEKPKGNFWVWPRIRAAIIPVIGLAALGIWLAIPASMPDRGKQLDPLQLKAREHILNTIKDERAGAERLLVLHQSEVKRLTEFYEEQRTRHVEGRVSKTELLEAEHAISEARRRVDEDKRRLAESDAALKNFIAEEEKLRSR